MPKKFSRILVLLILPSLVYAQPQKTKKDFNKDGVIDQLTVTEEGGSAFATKHVAYLDGRTNKRIIFDIDYSFGSFFSVCKIPSSIGNPTREIMGNTLFGPRDSIDASLAWLIDVTSSGGKNYKPIWTTGEPKIPAGYYTIVEEQHYKQFLKQLVGITDSNSRRNYYWIDYNTYGHYAQTTRRRTDSSITDDLSKIRIDSSTWLYRTSNGVILKIRNKYSWVFISDNQAGTSINEKLRWPTITDAKMFKGNVLILQQQAASSVLVVVNPITGDIVSLGEDDGFWGADEMKIGNDLVELISSDGKTYSLTQQKITELFDSSLRK